MVPGSSRQQLETAVTIGGTTMKDAGKSIEIGDQSMIEMGQSVEASIDIPNTAAEFESPVKLRDNLEE